MSDSAASTNACAISADPIFCITRKVRRPGKGGFLFLPLSTNPAAPLHCGARFCASTSSPGLGPMHAARGIGTQLGRCRWCPISSAVGNYASSTQTRRPFGGRPYLEFREIHGANARGRHSRSGPTFGPHHINPAHRSGIPLGHNSKIIGLLLLRLKGSHPVYEQGENLLLLFLS